MTDVGHKPGREKTARYITDNVLDPAPAKGATYRFDHGNSELTGFNPRTRKGCDENSGTKGSGGVCFNPRPREGCDRPSVRPGKPGVSEAFCEDLFLFT